MSGPTAIDRYLAELASSLQVRGFARPRFLRECREHLVDAVAKRGEAEGMRAFGEAKEIAAAFDAEIATHRSVRATFATVAAVAATAASTLVLIHASAPGATAPTAWAVVFFIAAQLAGVAAGLALLQALVTRAGMPAGDAVLLARRNGCALLAAALTMFAAGAALPGQASAPLLLAGPGVAGVAIVAVLRARALARRLDQSKAGAVRPPLVDLRRLSGLPVPLLRSPALLAATASLAATAAFLRDLGEHATVGGALITAAIEAGAVAGCYVVLGPPLGLWRRGQ
jgi:hypothetical protein